jgi:tetratricopeptide (TPR) repeat protein
MKVIARSSSFQYKGKEVDAQKIANALGVEAILTGRVAQRGDTLLINVEMVDTRDKTQVWGEQYNRKTTDILQIQSEISREVAEKLRLRLTTGEQQQLARRERANPQAYELLLKGRFYRNKGGTENAKKAVEYIQQAIAIDPAYAPAYADLSLNYSDLALASVLDPKEFNPKAEAAARKALELDESLAEAHAALALLKSQAWDWADAEREYKRAIELNPNLATARSYYAFYLGLVGQHEQAIAGIKRARELDPLSPGVNGDVGYQYFLARQYDQAIEAIKKSLELEQNNPYATRLLADVYAMKRMYAEAIASYEQVIKMGDAGPGTQIYLGAACAKAGERQRAQLILKQLEMKKEYISPGELAVLYVALGKREQALASLERAYAAHDSQLQFLGVDPSFDPLRSDPRFQDLMRRVGLPQ